MSYIHSKLYKNAIINNELTKYRKEHFLFVVLGSGSTSFFPSLLKVECIKYYNNRIVTVITKKLKTRADTCLTCYLLSNPYVEVQLFCTYCILKRSFILIKIPLNDDLYLLNNLFRGASYSSVFFKDKNIAKKQNLH